MIAFRKIYALGCLIILSMLLAFKVQAQTARDNFSKAKYALEEGSTNGCLIYLERCENQLGGSNVRIEALRAQCYALLDDYVKAKIAFRNYYNMLDVAERGGDTWETIARRADGVVKASTIAIMNGSTVSTPPRAGERIRVVVGG